ncbi:MAG TPA: YciI family protein [Aggregatilineales bacterium]|nr:YciI family protein [Anaerolineales bacterium]HRE48385.1 YciI family protein [Aggregatilineales bacterium]
MKYIFLRYEKEASRQAWTPEDFQKEMSDYKVFGAELQSRNLMIGGEALHDTNTATTARFRERKTLTTDGLFAETHEQLGGFYIVDGKDLDEASELAAKIPGAAEGCVEIRPLVVFE